MHSHKTDGHYLFVRKGEMRYWERPVGSTAAPEYRLIREGEMVFTGPGLDHWSEFPIGAELFCLSWHARSHEAHEADLVRVPWFEEDAT